MRKTAFFDLHCDTLTAYSSLTNEKAAFSLDNLPENSLWTQCCAIFIPDNRRGEDAVRYYEKYRDCLYKEAERLSDRLVHCRTADDVKSALASDRHAVVLTVEGGAALAGDLARVEKLYDDGVRMMTLTWNGENELGAGNDLPERGLTPFGRDAVREMERVGMVVDVSHLNDRGFWGVCEIAQKPFVASHSNSRSMCNVPRNLTDEQICEIIRRGGLIGLNYYTKFLGGEDMDRIWRHIEHMLSLGAEDVLALGSDYDGADIPECLAKPYRLPDMCDYLLARGLRDDMLTDILCGNAMKFFAGL